MFGIRHHGPGSARSLAAALARFRPDTILIEGPADADPLVAHVAAEDMQPPVALLAYVPGNPDRAAFWPFAIFSPEWQALRYAAEHAVPVGFCDLPASMVLAAGQAPGDRDDPLARLAAAGGYDDAERWWDAVVESAPDTVRRAWTDPVSDRRRHDEGAGTDTAPDRPHHDEGTRTEPVSDTAGTPRSDADSRHPTGSVDEILSDSDIFDALTEAMAALREDAEQIDEHTLRREAYMRQVMRKTLESGARRLAVVCGAWHAPALAGPLGPAAPDARLLKGAAKVKTDLTWIPWTHSRLASASGYGAGIDSPGWYHHLFTATEQPIVRWLTRVAGVLRAHDLPVSSAHVIEAVRLADTLAAMRDRPLAGLSEVTEAVRSVMCGGDDTMVRVVTDELVVGEALGAVPEAVPTVPLDADLRATARRLRLKQEPTGRAIDLDLRKERERERSHLLHRLALLGIPWGTPATSGVRATGTFRESWMLRWRPEFAVAVIEASRWGTTLRAAAEAKVLDTADGADRTLADLTDALEQALLADLTGAVPALIGRRAEIAALDHDVTHLLAALPGLIRTLRYGDVRGTDTAALAEVADGLLVRACAGLPGAVTGLDTAAAEQLRALLDAVHLAIHIRDDADATATWIDALTRLADRDGVHGALVGRAVRLLTDAGVLASEEAAVRLSAALSVGTTATQKASWVDGFVGGQGLLLVHDRPLLRLIDRWLRGLDEDQFTETLPVLRRTFGTFESGERQAIGRAVRDSGARAPAPAAAVAVIDDERGRRAMGTVAALLGIRGKDDSAGHR
nr:DUF5682 family protein [Nocardia higoensis]